MLQKHAPDKTTQGFTLVELSIVLVIIGLLVGGILIGRDLINAAMIRAQISQIEKYQAAVKTFGIKYNALPGDLTNDTASQLGFWSPRGNLASPSPPAADGDGNGVIEGGCGEGGGTFMEGETSMFWNDLGVSQLIDASFPKNVDVGIKALPRSGATLSVSAYLPLAKIGNGNYLYVWSGGYGYDYGDSGGGENVEPAICGDSDNATGAPGDDQTNYFALSQMPGGLNNVYLSGPGLTVMQAYLIDTKMDDGLPQSGRVIAMYPNYNASYNVLWALGGTSYVSAPTPANTAANPGTIYTCYDNSATVSGTPGVAGAMQHYSTEINGGNGVNCALSFKFQ